ncbi:adenosylcobinamide-GDP ribazoletransferase [Acinetobacter baumannii]|uniref:adenosylcobinamide-GDP ribazoletransferase n=1 Tax=Acinetobacter baumannii TaxID=470 RepID=UPI0007A3F965|nr:adenosylcobinamide-GDP ribazoletransferase [Acinetobacter baumannii]EHU2142990.1 adenosylcobinamide-GDP ribazoletransferase [Acinetobacter baumannii]EHU2654158.1 adenosylcobinamide-GDP ribazoletransferase [Acinetobacter baumannii]EHU2656485.1 adenosylcobinamide-GDP ribazoletransferase [Acinetobacter baumannii]EHU2722594.1 adenosylcobinamide-GDP ribazoletransferase [Acinetobacter baumannii]EHU2840689.1 adenosylcobinamide-GDP ribazoletransferase [Acinetobacter baumannii]
MTPFWIALQFLTVLPIELKTIPTAQQNGRAILFYPLVGLIIGGILFLVTCIFVKLPALLLTAIVLALWIWLTGGLHLDGLADTADAWVGGFGDKLRTLQIMKDPSCGPIGVLSLVIICLLKFSLIYVLIEQHQSLFLICIPILGRVVPSILFLTTPYVREKGLGRSLTDYLPKTASWIITGFVLLLPLYWGWQGLIAIIGFLISLVYLRHLFLKRISGITGDTVGAAIEISETVLLFTFVVSYFYLF